MRQGIVLGKKLQNPYSVSNMKKALAELNKTKKSPQVTEADIVTTHYYVKFTPQSDEELNNLKSDSLIITYPYPLDYELLNEGSINTTTNEYYASVPVHHPLPKTNYEVLEHLFIPDEEKDNSAKSSNKIVKNNTLSEDLVSISLKLTGNEDDKAVNIAGRRSSWRPAGRITMEDTKLGNVGITGLKVKARRWFTTHTGFVNADGYYSCDGTFRRPANYSFNWERHNFEIRGISIGVDGPKKTGNWDMHIPRANPLNYFAVIFRAAHHYYYEDIQGLKRPPENSFWKTQMKILASFETREDLNGFHNPSKRFLGLGNPIQIFNPDRESHRVYATVIHELAHASHWNMDTGNYINAEHIVAETWARGVEWTLTRMKYPNYAGSYLRGGYTGLIQDLIDGEKFVISYLYKDKNSKSYEEISLSYEDKVSGYTISQLEDALQGTNNWLGWRNNIIAYYDNPTENNITEAFYFWASKHKNY